MKRAVMMFAGVALFFATAVVALPPLDPSNGIVFPLDRAKEVTLQCSRSAPGPVDGTWLPTAKEIRDLEARLPGALDNALAKRGQFAERSRDIGRQYAGLRVAGHKIIYVNGFPLSMFETEARYVPGLSRDDWKSQPVMVCDGGPAFFGVEYDPANKTFSHFAFNGIA